MQPLKWQWEKYRLSVIFLKRIQAKSLKFISWGENHGYLWFIFISYVPQNALNQNWDVKGEMSRIHWLHQWINWQLFCHWTVKNLVNCDEDQIRDIALKINKSGQCKTLLLDYYFYRSRVLILSQNMSGNELSFLFWAH